MGEGLSGISGGTAPLLTGSRCAVPARSIDYPFPSHFVRSTFKQKSFVPAVE
jgi:hypothetical protein